MYKNHRIIIVARGGAGKDYLRKKFQKRGFSYCISYTSRPKRDGEIEGKDYYFVDDSYFRNNVHQFYEIDDFNNWKYGRKINDFYKSNILLMTPSGIKNLIPADRRTSFIIYLDMPREILWERLTKRKDADSAERRMLSDDIDFKDFSDYDLRITNEDF